MKAVALLPECKEAHDNCENGWKKVFTLEDDLPLRPVFIRHNSLPRVVRR